MNGLQLPEQPQIDNHHRADQHGQSDRVEPECYIITARRRCHPFAKRARLHPVQGGGRAFW